VNWPSFFPQSCPPSEAEDASAEVFRLVYSSPPSASDFRSYAEKLPDKWRGNCKASGLSVFTDKADATRLIRRVPGMLAPGSSLASAILTPAAGKLMHTPKDGNSHHTWWAPDGFDHASAFTVVA
jgi:hypothetical protein